MSDIQIIPAILATNEQELADELKKIQSSRALDDSWVHFDFMDNKFVPNKSISPSTLSNQNIKHKKEAHLMVSNPSEMVNELKELSFERITIHIEAENIRKTFEDIKSLGIKVGLAIKNETPLEEAMLYLKDIDQLLVMTIKPGFQGQPFIEGSLERIRQVFKIREENKLGFKIAVDGAVRDINVGLLVAAGADQLIVGSFLQEGDIDENLEKLWEAIRG